MGVALGSIKVNMPSCVCLALNSTPGTVSKPLAMASFNGFSDVKNFVKLIHCISINPYSITNYLY